MTTIQTRKQLGRFKHLLASALEANNSDLVIQYWKGMSAAKDDHIAALERELTTIKLKTRYKKVV